jgi:uncharacterized protein YndB with AHSA1/START domain
MTNLLDHNIKQVTYIAVSPEKVYDTITSAGEWDAFFTTGMELDPVPGGKFIWSWKDWGPSFYTLKVNGKVREAERPYKFVFEWGDRNPTTITMKLKAHGKGTVLTLTETGYHDTPEGRAMILECAAGWGEALTLLKFYIEHGVTYSPPEKL